MATVQYVNGMDYGRGFNDLSGVLRGEAVIRGSVEDLTGAQGQVTEFSVEQIETVESLKQSLGVEVNADVTFPMWSAGASFNFAKSCAVNSYSCYLVVIAEVLNSFRQMRDVRLRSEALELIENGKTDRFDEQFGTHFVNGMATGGSLFSVLEIQTRSEEERQDISASLRASGGGGLFKLDAQFEHSVQQAASKTALTVRTLQQGGKNTQQPTTAADIIRKAQTFPSDVAGNFAVAYEVEALDYRALDMPDLPNKIDRENAKNVLRDCYELANDLEEQRNDCLYCLVNQNQFVNPDVNKLNEMVTALNDAIKVLTRAASKAMNYPLEAQFPEIEIPKVVIPPRKGRKSVEIDAGAGRNTHGIPPERYAALQAKAAEMAKGKPGELRLVRTYFRQLVEKEKKSAGRTAGGRKGIVSRIGTGA